jgi:plasmid stabilization system protein ParE
MVYEVLVTRAADAEADEIFERIFQAAPSAAIRWYRGLLKAIHSLEHNPNRCPLAPEDEDFPEQMRNLLYGKRRHIYRVIFTIRNDTVYVLHIRHAARQVLKPKPPPKKDDT